MLGAAYFEAIRFRSRFTLRQPSDSVVELLNIAIKRLEDQSKQLVAQNDVSVGGRGFNPITVTEAGIVAGRFAAVQKFLFRLAEI